MNHLPAHSVPSTPRFPLGTQLLSATVSNCVPCFTCWCGITYTDYVNVTCLLMPLCHFALFKTSNITVRQTEALASVQQQLQDQQLRLHRDAADTCGDVHWWYDESWESWLTKPYNGRWLLLVVKAKCKSTYFVTFRMLRTEAENLSEREVTLTFVCYLPLKAIDPTGLLLFH